MTDALQKIAEQLKHIEPSDLTKAEKNILRIIEESTNTKTLEDLLEEWSVMFPGTWENDNSPTLGEWYAVANDEGIVAYFGSEKDAFAFRLMKINQVLNG